jgi:hypothetical protein
MCKALIIHFSSYLSVWSFALYRCLYTVAPISTKFGTTINDLEEHSDIRKPKSIHSTNQGTPYLAANHTEEEPREGVTKIPTGVSIPEVY